MTREKYLPVVGRELSCARPACGQRDTGGLGGGEESKNSYYKIENEIKGDILATRPSFGWRRPQSQSVSSNPIFYFESAF